MRKLIIKSAFVAAFIAVAGYAAYNTQKDTEMSDLAMAMWLWWGGLEEQIVGFAERTKKIIILK